MAMTPLFTCLCGTQKKNTNHWVLARVTDAKVQFVPWDSKLAQQDDIIVLCGEACAAALLSRALGDWKQRSTAPSGETRYSHADEMAVA